MKRALLFLSLAASLALAGTVEPKPGEGVLVNSVVAIVNNEAVTKMEVDQLVAEFLRGSPELTPEQLRQALEKARELLIDDRLLVQEARRRRTEVDPAAVAAEIQRLKDAGVDADGRRDVIRERLMVARMLSALQTVRTVTPQEVDEYYEQHHDEFDLPERRHILLLAVYARKLTAADGREGTLADAKKLADDIRKRLDEGADFAALARKHSHGPFADKGGDQGWYTRGTLVKALDDAAFTLNPGEVSAPIASADGYLLLKLAGVQPASRKSLAEARPDILRRLQLDYRKKQEKQLLERLRQAASIVRFDLRPKDAQKP